MSKKPKPNTAVAEIDADTTTYDERSALARRETVSTLMTEGVKEFDEGVVEIGDGAKGIIRGCNRIWEAGRKFNDAEQTGQIEFKSWHTDIESWRQDAVRKEKVKSAIHVFKAMPGKAERMEDCVPVMQELFRLSGVLKEQKGRGKETLREKMNPLSAVVSSSATVLGWFEAMEPKGVPLRDYYFSCGEDKLTQIERALRPFAERHEVAVQALKAIVPA